MRSGKNNDSGREAARVLNAASDQIDLALQQSQPSVDALGEALCKLANALAAAAAGGGNRNDALPAMRIEMLRAITCLQYHDRMTQHLSHVRDYLASSARQMSAQDERGDDDWNGLHRQLRDRLLSETQRMRLGKNFPTGSFTDDEPKSGESRGAAKPGDIDLF